MSWNKTHSKFLAEKVERLKEANKLLRERIEQLQSRSCEGCKWERFCGIRKTIVEHHQVELPNFCCNRYEPKGNQ